MMKELKKHKETDELGCPVRSFCLRFGINAWVEQLLYHVAISNKHKCPESGKPDRMRHAVKMQLDFCKAFEDFCPKDNKGNSTAAYHRIQN